MALVRSEIDTSKVFERLLSSVQKHSLGPFYCKTRPSGLSLESPTLENIPQVPRNQAEVGQNHDASKAVSATISVLK